MFIRVVSFLIGVSVCLYAMEKQTLTPEHIKEIAELVATNPSYGVQAVDTLPRDLSMSVVQRLMLDNRSKSALPLSLLSYKLYQQRQHTNINQRIVNLALANNQQVQLTPQQSGELIQASTTIKSLIQDLDNQGQAEEIPLLLLTHEQVTALLPYISIINALNTSISALPALQQEIPETTMLSSSWWRYTAQHELKEYITACTIPTLCDLIRAASYLDTQSEQEGINFIELATHALGNKLLQAPEYQEEYTIINTLPNNIQRMLAQCLVRNSRIRSVLCCNSTDTIANTRQTLTCNPETVYSFYLFDDNINSISWSPNGKQLASISGHGKVRIWDPTLKENNQRILDWYGEQGCSSVAWSPDGKCIASVEDRCIYIRDATTGKTIHNLFNSYILNSVAWSPDSSMIVIGSNGSLVEVWNAITGTCIHTLKGHARWVCSVSWSSDGQYIASGSSDDTIRIWNANTGTCVHVFEGHKGDVRSVSWSPDGKYIASGSSDKTIKVWDATNYTCMHTLTGHEDSINEVSWSPDGKYIASGSSDRTLRVWDATTYTCMHILKKHDYGVNTVSWSPDSNQLVSSSNGRTIQIWNIRDKELDNYLQTTLSWEQALLLIRIINAYYDKHDINLAQDIRALQCYNSLDQRVKQLVDPLLLEKIRAAL